MSKSKSQINETYSDLKIKEFKEISNNLSSLMPSKNSLFSEIIKNHSNYNSTILTEQMGFNVRDVPLPLESSKKITKSEKCRKRVNNEVDETISKKKRQCDASDSNEKTEINDECIMPKICEKRTHIRHNSTWGERSVKAFKILKEIGEGTYGHVFKAMDRISNIVVALKKVRLENEKEGFPITTVREIKILQQLNHDNIVRLHEVVTDYDLIDAVQPNGGVRDKGFYLVFEYMDHDLYGILDSGINLTELQVASFIKQILDGINYSHRKMFLHRDIKCSNILINNRGEVKIADFGLSRCFYADNIKRPYTNKVITLWYRAPELLLGEECYGTAIDLWSIGCILGELFTHRTMFMASAEMEQLDAIGKVCGTPCVATWPDVTKLPLFDSYRPRSNGKRHLREYYCTLPNGALDVLDWMLQLDPKRRCTADQALRSYWLNKIDPRKIAPPQFPTDMDYHELSCKRRHKKNGSEPATTHKSSAKAQHSSCSNISDGAGNGRQTSQANQITVLPRPGEKAELAESVSSFELTDDLLAMLNEQDTIKQLLQSSNLSDTSSIKETLERLLEPYIKQLLSRVHGVIGNNISQSMDSGGSDALTSDQSNITPNILSDKQL